MREFKFKGKDVKGNWVFGNLHVNENSLDTTKNLYYIIRQCFVPALTMPASNYIEVDPKTVGQYINKDYEDGTQMFEGDIVECFQTETNFVGGQMADSIKVESLIGVITFQDGQIGVLSGGLFHSDALKNAPHVDKLGNIHDNPTPNA